MFLPTGDTPNPRNYTPWVNYTLIALNIAVYFFITIPLSYQRAGKLKSMERDKKLMGWL